MKKQISIINTEGYTDSTAFAAINRIIRERSERKDISMNSWHGIGVVSKDPKVDTGRTGEACMRLVLVIPRKTAEQTAYISVRLGSRLTAQYRDKIVRGDSVGVTGRLQTWTYTPEDGIKRFGYEILAEEVNLLKSTSPAAPDD